MRHWMFRATLTVSMALLAGIAISQEAQIEDEHGAKQQAPGQGITPEQRAQAMRAFLGLGTAPDKAAAARAEPVFQQNCAFCHGKQARGATGSSLITSDEVLGDDHGEHLVPFLKKGRPEKGMPAFATMTDEQLKDIAEFIHLQVEEVANRGAYHVLNILVGDAAKGQSYVAARCMRCHGAETFAHLGSRFRSPEQLQKGWIWPARSMKATSSRAGSETNAGDDPLAMTATVKLPRGGAIAGRVTQVSDFRITLVDGAGQTHAIELVPGVQVAMKDPLTAHEEMIQTLSNEDMHNVTAYLETLK